MSALADLCSIVEKAVMRDFTKAKTSIHEPLPHDCVSIRNSQKLAHAFYVQAGAFVQTVDSTRVDRRWRRTVQVGDLLALLSGVMLMEMPYEPEVEAEAVVSRAALAGIEPSFGDWRSGLPTLTGARVTLRELRVSDAPSLFTALLNEEVTRFISPPPPTLVGLERFIIWTQRQRAAGQSICFAIVPHGSDEAVGLFQVRLLDFRFRTAEWGFVLASEFWGEGLFGDGARLLIDFAFDVVGSRRLEARAAVKNVRGNAALRKLGAVREGLLRKSFLRNGEFFDQSLWTILAEDWREATPTWESPSIH